MNKLHRYIIGAGGGGKGGGSQRSPVEDKDNLRSRAYAKIIDVLGEGQIFGLANGLKSIYFDDVPLQNADGSYNFQDVAIDFRDGSIGQSALSNDEGSENTQSVNVELKYNVPSVRSIINAETDYCRVAIAVGALNSTDTRNGDVHGTSVSHLIEYRANGGAWQTVKTDTITGKTSSGYERTVTFKLSGSAPWDVRVTRKTTNSTSQYLQNNSKWTMLSEVIADKLRYPATALVGMQINAEQFSNIPTRAYDVKGLIIKVPSNYNPETRAYTGSWDGTFKMEWTNNPAWCLYDILLNDRYGLGGRIDAAMLDKWQFYSIAQYCDELVPDGRGGMEPRFTCNLYLQTRAAAYNFIRDMASIFRGITYWASGAIVVKQDAPASVRYQFNNSNVENGIFDRAGSNIQTRHNVALVTWNDPQDRYRQKIEYVEDSAAIQRMGYTSEIEVAAFGCTSQGQARRYGEWLLYTEQYESDIVSFTAGLDGAIPLPSDIIQISDVYHSGERRGGRVLATSTRTSVKLDSAVTLISGKSYTLSVIDVDGGFMSRTVTTAAGETSVIEIGEGYSKDIAENSTWVLSDSSVTPEIFRVVGIDELEFGKYKISCLSHNPNKYNHIERDLGLGIQQTRASVYPKAKNILVNEVEKTNNDGLGYLDVSWANSNQIEDTFIVKYRVSNGSWVTLPATSSHNAQIPLYSSGGAYEIQVVAGSRLLGIYDPSPESILFRPIAYSNISPRNVENFEIQMQSDGTRQFSWGWGDKTKPTYLAGYRIRYRQGQGWTWGDMLPLDTDSGFFTVSPHETNMLLAGEYVFAIKTVDKFGNESQDALYIDATLDDPRFGRNLFGEIVHETGWVGTKLNCHIEKFELIANDQATWGTLPNTWDAWTNWTFAPFNTIVYTHTAIDCGANVSIRPVAKVEASGQYTVEVRTSSDNATWGAWQIANSNVTCRYIQFRVTVTGSLPILRKLELYGDAKIVSETINDLVVSSEALGSKYIGVGDIRAPISNSYSTIREVLVTFQNVSGNWGYSVIDKNPTQGARIQFYNPQNQLADPPSVDIYIKGLKAI